MPTQKHHYFVVMSVIVLLAVHAHTAFSLSLAAFWLLYAPVVHSANDSPYVVLCTKGTAYHPNILPCLPCFRLLDAPQSI